MKLVTSRIAHADTITTDDGIALGVVYYSAVPLNDDGQNGQDLFREWFEEARSLMTLTLADNHLTAEPRDNPMVQEVLDAAEDDDVPPSPAG